MGNWGRDLRFSKKNRIPGLPLVCGRRFCLCSSSGPLCFLEWRSATGYRGLASKDSGRHARRGSMKRVGLRAWRRLGRYVGWVLLILTGLLLGAWLVFDEFFFRPVIFRTILEAMTDVQLRGISLEEARRRAPFPICLPAWLPEGLEGPEIAFHAEWGGPLGGRCHLGLSASWGVHTENLSNLSRGTCSSAPCYSSRGPIGARYSKCGICFVGMTSGIC